MVNFFQLNNLYNKHVAKEYGELMGDLYSIYSVNYSTTDNTPVLKFANVRGRVDPTGPKYSEPTFAGVENYSIFFNRNLIETGDMLIYGDINTYNVERPYLTVMHSAPIKEHVAFRTSRKCNLATSRNQDTDEYNNLYTNAYYDILDVGYPTSNITGGSFRNSTQLPISKIAMYRRNLLTDVRTLIVDIDPVTGAETGEVYLIKQIDYSGALMILTVENNFRN